MENVEIVRQFLAIQGDAGFGYGSGSCFGFGYGSGNGDGFGYGYGSCFGFGYGSGNGDGFGHGSCFGNGYGDGFGDGVKSINGETVWFVDGVPTLIDKVRVYYANGRILNSDLTLTPCYVARVDNSFAHGATLRKAVADATTKALNVLPKEERIKRFRNAFPTMETKATCATFFEWHHILTGSCEMGRKKFIKEHNLDMDKEYTVRYFLDITEKAYGGEIIIKLKNSYDERRYTTTT